MPRKDTELGDAVDLAVLLGDTRTIDSLLASVVQTTESIEGVTGELLIEMAEDEESESVGTFVDFLDTRAYLSSPDDLFEDSYDVCVDLLIDARRARKVLDAEREESDPLSFELVCTLPSQDPAFTDHDPIDFGMQQITSRLLGLCRESEDSLVLVSPYLEVGGIDWLFPGLEGALERGVDLTLVSRELEEGGANFRAIERLVKAAEECEGRLAVYDYYQPRSDSDKPLYTLHSKLLLADDDVAYLGSANFTRYGFSENLEVGVVLEGGDVSQLGKLLRHVIENSAIQV